MERRILELAEYIKFLEAKELAAGDVARSTLCATAETVCRIEDTSTFKAAKIADPDELLEGGFLRHVASVVTEDRHGDIVSAKGWELEAYKKNPVVLWAHSHGTPPVGKNVDIEVKRKKLIGISEYPSEKMYEFGNTAFRLAALGYMKAVSVGFIPLKFELIDEENPWGGVKTLSQDLLEYSIVPVPANPNALTLAAKGVIGFGAVRAWAEEVLDVEPQSVNMKMLGDALKNLSGNPVTITLGSPEPVSTGSPVEDAEDEEDMNTKEVFLSDTRDHDEEKGICIRIVDQESPVILTIVDEPTFDVDVVAIQRMVTESLDRRRGKLIDTDFGG